MIIAWYDIEALKILVKVYQNNGLNYETLEIDDVSNISGLSGTVGSPSVSIDEKETFTITWQDNLGYLFVERFNLFTLESMGKTNFGPSTTGNPEHISDTRHQSILGDDGDRYRLFHLL